MNREHLTPRLLAIARQVKPCRTAVDVGCDHAQVGIWLVKNQIVDKMTVSDVNTGPIIRARLAIVQAGLDGKIDCIQCDGLHGIKPQNTVIIAGMGGDLICEILKAAEWTKKDCRMVLQPMTAGEVLRAFLFNNGYKIVKETIAREREKYYTILTVEPGDQGTWDDAMLYLSEYSDPLSGEYIKKIIRRMKRIISGKCRSAERDEEEIKKLEALVLKLYERCKNHAESV